MEKTNKIRFWVLLAVIDICSWHFSVSLALLLSAILWPMFGATAFSSKQICVIKTSWRCSYKYTNPLRCFIFLGCHNSLPLLFGRFDVQPFACMEQPKWLTKPFELTCSVDFNQRNTQNRPYATKNPTKINQPKYCVFIRIKRFMMSMRSPMHMPHAHIRRHEMNWHGSTLQSRIFSILTLCLSPFRNRPRSFWHYIYCTAQPIHTLIKCSNSNHVDNQLLLPSPFHEQQPHHSSNCFFLVARSTHMSVTYSMEMQSQLQKEVYAISINRMRQSPWISFCYFSLPFSPRLFSLGGWSSDIM